MGTTAARATVPTQQAGQRVRQKPSEDDAVAVAPLASVAFVCRLRPPSDAISAIVWTIDGFLCPAPRWTVPSVCCRNPPGAIRFLPQVAAAEDVEMDDLYKRKLVADGPTGAITSDNFNAVRWLVDEYLPTGRIRDEAAKAVKRGQMHLIKWLHAHHASRVVWTTGLL